MSRWHEDELICPGCGCKIPFIVLDSINIAKDPGYKEKILDGSAFCYDCPECGDHGYVSYPMLYFDKERRFAVRICCTEVGMRETGIPDDVKNAMQKEPGKSYQFRNVLTHYDLIEKIRIFESGLDDYAIEFYKAVQKPKYPDVDLLFDHVNEEEFVFLMYQDNEELPNAMYAPKSDYPQLVNLSSDYKSWNEDEFLRVDYTLYDDDMSRF